MPDAVNKARLKSRKRMLLGMLGIVLILVLSFGGWVYKAKTQRDLNRQLIAVVLDGDAEAAQSLLKRGADPNIRNVPEQPLSLLRLIRHAFHKDSKTAQDHMDSESRTMLEMALDIDGEHDPENENVALVKVLLDAGARTEDSSFCHQTPLMWAISYDRLQTVQTLLDHGADLLAKDDRAQLPIYFLNDRGTDELKIAELLVKRGSDVNAVDYKGTTPLMNLIGGRKEDLQVVQFLIAHGADVNARSQGGYSALLVSTDIQDSQITRLLLEHGAEVNVYDFKDKNSALQKAVEHDSLQEIAMLIAYGADVNHRNKAGETALSLAKKQNYPKRIRLLEAAGAKQ